VTPPVSHRCDEFPAEYSLASCSPALLASAFSAMLMLQPITFVRRANLSERQPGNSSTVSPQGVTAHSLQISRLFEKGVEQSETNVAEDRGAIRLSS
jgi:hypothetical protein